MRRSSATRTAGVSVASAGRRAHHQASARLRTGQVVIDRHPEERGDLVHRGRFTASAKSSAAFVSSITRLTTARYIDALSGKASYSLGRLTPAASAKSVSEAPAYPLSQNTPSTDQARGRHRSVWRRPRPRAPACLHFCTDLNIIADNGACPLSNSPSTTPMIKCV